MSSELASCRYERPHHQRRSERDEPRGCAIRGRERAAHRDRWRCVQARYQRIRPLSLSPSRYDINERCGASRADTHTCRIYSLADTSTETDCRPPTAPGATPSGCERPSGRLAPEQPAGCSQRRRISVPSIPRGHDAQRGDGRIQRSVAFHRRLVGCERAST